MWNARSKNVKKKGKTNVKKMITRKFKMWKNENKKNGKKNCFEKKTIVW
jgi:hypothetical protein